MVVSSKKSSSENVSMLISLNIRSILAYDYSIVNFRMRVK
jgi:hypothetical protein